MKGSVIADLVGLMVLLGLTLFSSILIIHLHNMTSFLDDTQTFNLTVQSIYKPLTAETELLAYVELKPAGCGGKKIKEIIPLIIEYNSTGFATIMPGCDISTSWGWYGEGDFILVLSTDEGTEDLIIGGSVADTDDFQEVSVKMYSPSSKTGELSLYIGE